MASNDRGAARRSKALSLARSSQLALLLAGRLQFYVRSYLVGFGAGAILMILDLIVWNPESSR